jgi:hypothetical protein
VKLQNTITNNLSKGLPAFIAYGLLVVIVLFLGRLQRTGIISTAWVLFIFAWLVFATCGFILGTLRILNIFTKKQSQIYVFLAIANLGNAIIGAILYHHPDPTTNATLIWLLLGITFCLASLMLIDIFL